MYFLTDKQLSIKKLASDFVSTDIAPLAHKMDKTNDFPWAWIKQCSNLNLFALSFPQEYGGSGLGILEEVLVIEEIAKESASLALSMSAHILQGCMMLYLAGTEEQKQKYLVPAVKGEVMIAFGLTEEEAGSNAGGLQTTARLDGDEWVLNGSKSWITNAQVANVYIVAAKTAPEKANRGISAFIVEAGTEGFSIVIKDKMGLNNSPAGDLYLNNCRIPKENLLGELNNGYNYCLKSVNDGRISISAMAVGLAQGALERALFYSKKRTQFGRPISSFQGVSFILAEMYTNIEIARTMLYRVAKMRDEGISSLKELVALKLFSSEMCCDVCDNAIQIFGANGYSKDFEVERFSRDSKMLKIGQGTSQICKVIISQALLNMHD